MKLPITSLFTSLGNLMTKMAADEELAPPTDEAPVDDMGSAPSAEPAAAPEEEKDQDTLLQEHVKNNQDKYRMAFEDLFTRAQMVAKNVEYHGAVLKDKVRVLVDFETPMLNFDALQTLSDKEIGLEATGENTFRVYNIYLTKVKDPTLK